MQEIKILKEDFSNSPLYSEDLAPVAPEDRTWTSLNLAALWVGMVVCIPTYLLASYMIKSGLRWYEALIIIGLANLIITIPMVLNGHAGVKYGVPFPVIGRASFGIRGIHIPAIIRALVACGWFGIQTWIGGLAIYSIYNVVMGLDGDTGLTIAKFVSFGIFWLINMYFIWKGIEHIKWLEAYAAPILVGIGILLIFWGARQAGGFAQVLAQSSQLERPEAEIDDTKNPAVLRINPIRNLDKSIKATKMQLLMGDDEGFWIPLDRTEMQMASYHPSADYYIRLKNEEHISSKVKVKIRSQEASSGSKWWSYVLWLTAMVGFWATMSLSIADITRYAGSQKAQIMGQFIGLPTTMMLFSFVGIFLTCAALIQFDDILIASDAPWDPVTLLDKFDNKWVVVLAQVFMLIATLSTNIAANVIAPSNAFSNLLPKKISFKMGGWITGVIGILIFPWALIDEISSLLIFVSGLLGPVLGIMLADYFVVRKTNMPLAELYKLDGIFYYKNGFNLSAVYAFVLGVGIALIGYFVPSLSALYKLSWFTGFVISFLLYVVFMKRLA